MKERKAGSARILDGLLIVDLATLITGPYCASLLGDLGAEVIKIEFPEGGDPLRHLGTLVGNESTLFLAVNRNKKSLTLNLAKEEGHKVLERILSRADVVIENFRPDIKEKYRIRYEDLQTINPALICLSITGFGEDGPYALKAGTDHVFQSVSGIMTTSGVAGHGPLRIGVPIADVTAGLYSAFGVIGALFHRQKSGRGQKISINLLDAVMGLQMTQITEYLMTGKAPRQCGNDSPFAYPVGVFRTANGYLSISAFTDKFWRGLCQALSLAPLISDERFVTEQDRFIHKDELRPFLEKAFSQDTTEAWLAVLERADVPCGPVHDYGHLFADPQVIHNDLVKRLFPHPSLEPVPVVGNPLHFTETPPAEKRAAPFLGEDTEEILRICGYTEEEIRQMRGRGIL